MDEAAIFAAKKIFEKDAQGERKLCQVGDALLFEEFEAVNLKGLSADIQFVACAERIARVNGHPDDPFELVGSLL
jgi:hypothetical protein